MCFFRFLRKKKKQHIYKGVLRVGDTCCWNKEKETITFRRGLRSFVIGRRDTFEWSGLTEEQFLFIISIIGFASGLTPTFLQETDKFLRYIFEDKG